MIQSVELPINYMSRNARCSNARTLALLGQRYEYTKLPGASPLRGRHLRPLGKGAHDAVIRYFIDAKVKKKGSIGAHCQIGLEKGQLWRKLLLQIMFHNRPMSIP